MLLRLISPKNHWGLHTDVLSWRFDLRNESGFSFSLRFLTLEKSMNLWLFVDVQSYLNVKSILKCVNIVGWTKFRR